MIARCHFTGSTRIVVRLATVLLMVLLVGGTRSAAAEEIVVFAAASLKNALDHAVVIFQQYMTVWAGDTIDQSRACWTLPFVCFAER